MSTSLEFYQDLPKNRILKPINDLTIQRRDDSAKAGCCTPTAKEHKIPKLITCPPAPQKPKGSVVSCKRRLTEFDFFEIAHRDEVDEFFRSGFETSTATKRRCRGLKFGSES